MTERKRALGSDLAKADAHVITPEEYEEIPELTDDDFARGTPSIGGRVVSEEEFRAAVRKIGRPRSKHPKEAVNLRLDSDVLAHFRSLGPGWQTRINAALRQAARLPKQTKRA